MHSNSPRTVGNDHAINRKSRSETRDCQFGVGAEGGNRTRTPLRTQDFKSWASTNSATPAHAFSKISTSVRAGKGAGGDGYVRILANRSVPLFMETYAWILWLVLG